MAGAADGEAPLQEFEALVGSGLELLVEEAGSGEEDGLALVRFLVESAVDEVGLALFAVVLESHAVYLSFGCSIKQMDAEASPLLIAEPLVIPVLLPEGVE